LTPLAGSLKTINITYRTPEETLLSTPEILPTSEPETPQITKTLTADDFPIFDAKPVKVTFVGWLIAAGKYPTAGSLYFRLLKNGVSIWYYSGTVYAGYFWTLHTFFFDVKVGDVLAVKLWSNQTDSYWDYKAFQIQLTRVFPVSQRLLSPFKIASLAAHPVLTLGNPSVATTESLRVYVGDAITVSTTSPLDWKIGYAGTYGVCRIYYGDIFSYPVYLYISMTYRPHYIRNWLPTKIVTRGWRTDGL